MPYVADKALLATLEPGPDLAQDALLWARPVNRADGRTSEIAQTIANDSFESLTSSSSPSNAFVSSPSVQALKKRQEMKPFQSPVRTAPSQSSPYFQRKEWTIPEAAYDVEGTTSLQSRSHSLVGGSNSQLDLAHAPPTVQGIPLVSVRELPDRLRSTFSFPLFNAIQSKSFESVYHTDDNVVLSAPTGSGKTVIMELAICRLLVNKNDEHCKIIYQAPTKSLCSERFRDWQSKFTTLGLQCAELTGDTESTNLRHVQSARVIVTTPEKWDSVTRKWKDHQRLMQMIKLFLIDEVHILKESRGATLEAVVSRMKSTGTNVRFIALSATVPNSEDIATWLGRNSMAQHLPAQRYTFDEEFRPVKLQKHVYGLKSNGNDFAFDKLCEGKLLEIIANYSSGKPAMIFCCTRNSAISTAKMLAKSWSASHSSRRLWPSPNCAMRFQHTDLRSRSPIYP